MPQPAAPLWFTVLWSTPANRAAQARRFQAQQGPYASHSLQNNGAAGLTRLHVNIGDEEPSDLLTRHRHPREVMQPLAPMMYQDVHTYEVATSHHGSQKRPATHSVKDISVMH